MNREYIFYVVLISCLISINNTLYARSFDQLRTIQSDGLASTAQISGIVKPTGTSNDDYLNTFTTFEDTEKLDIELSIDIAKEDIGFESSIYLLIKFNDDLYFCNSSGECNIAISNQPLSQISVYKQKVLEIKESLPIVTDKLLGAGEYLVYIAYLNRQNKLVYNEEPLSFIIFSADKASLHQFHSSYSMTAYFKSALRNKVYSNYESNGFSGAKQKTRADTGSSLSSFNVQQQRVKQQDIKEADIIKTDGKRLFAIKTCQSNSNKCLGAYNINESPASNSLISEYEIGSSDDYSNHNIYYIENNNDDNKLSIVISISDDMKGYLNNASNPNFWKGSKTAIEFIDASTSSDMKSLHRIKLEGQLVSSRLIGNMFYLVTRTSPDIEGYKDEYLFDTIDITQQDIDNNQKLLDDFDINDYLPTIVINDQDETPLHQVRDCYLPPHTSKKLADRTIISVTAIPIDDITSYKSNCIVGTTETLYASEQAIYLVTSRYQYDYLETTNKSGFSGGTPSFTPGNKTEIHKLSMTKQELEYKGSGIINGNLGRDYDKKLFRMSEYNNQLRIVTSIGNRWNNDSSNSLQIIAENEQGTGLEKISGIEGLGKSSEDLYAVRFIGTRAYLVTFNQTGSIYAINLEDSNNPKVIDKLEVDGYFSYLYPVGDSLLLGIGSSSKFSGIETQYSFKISLLGVASTGSIHEIQTLDKGTFKGYSDVLYNYKTFAFLAGDGNRPYRFAFPLHLIDTKICGQAYLYNAYCYNSWTNTGLYVYDLDTANPGFTLNDRLIIADRNTTEYVRDSNPRSVLQGNTVHYFTNNKIISKALSD